MSSKRRRGPRLRPETPQFQSRNEPTLRSLRSQERQLIKPSAHGGDLKFHLTYPNTYWIGMSNLGFQAVYTLLAKQEGVAVERAFMPQELAQPSTELRSCTTFETERDLRECDVLGFSLSFETDYPHMLRMLASIQMLSADPEQRDLWAMQRRFGSPLIIAGGTAVTLNPEPVADFVDVAFVGEAEEFIPEFVSVLRSGKEQLSREELLLRLSRLEGVYVPRFVKPIYGAGGALSGYLRDGRAPRPVRRFVKDLSKYPTYTSILTPQTEFRDMFLTETGRGCEMGCRFCVAGYIYRPVRKRSEEAVADTVKIGLESSEAVGFVGAAVSSHRSISKLAKSVADSGARASLSSIMSQRVSRELAASITESEYKTVALAPEAGSERLRRSAGKRVSNAQIIEAASMLAEAGIRGFKLYFMVGLPTENNSDLREIIQLSREVRDKVIDISKGFGRTAWVTLSVNPFIPKASTPFQWEPMLERRELERKIDVLKASLKLIPNLEMNYESPRESYFQALLSRGDRRVGKLLLEAELMGRDWKWLVSRAGREFALSFVPSLDYYITRRFDFEEVLPWEVIDSRIDPDLLKREALRAYYGEHYNLEESVQVLEAV